MSTIARPWSLHRPTSSDRGSVMSSVLFELLLWLPTALGWMDEGSLGRISTTVWDSNRCHGAARVSNGKCERIPHIYLNSEPWSLAHADCALAPLRDFKSSGTDCSCPPSLTTSEYRLLASSNNCTRHDFTSPAGMNSVSAVTTTMRQHCRDISINVL